MKINKTYNEDCLDTMRRMPADFIDLTVTSPPYDGLRVYNGYSFDFENIARELYRVTKPGGVVVWVVGDATVKGSESGTSFRQALFFKDCGFNLHDTMIYSKSGLTMNHNRYEQEFEYMFIFSKGRPKTFNAIRILCKFPETNRNGNYSQTKENRKARSEKIRKPVGIDKIKGNIWYYPTGKNHSSKDNIAFNHPAIFPEKLAEDHVITWSNENELIYDPFMGSGTTAKMALLNNRKFVGSEVSKEYTEIIENRIRIILQKIEFSENLDF